MSFKPLFLLTFAALLQFSASAAAPLFDDPIIAKGKNLQVRQSELEQAVIGFKAARAAAGQPVNGVAEKAIEQQSLDKLIATKVVLARATPEDKKIGEETAQKFLKENRARVGSEQSFQRQLIAMGTTLAQYEKDVIDQAVVKAVIDRELKDAAKVTDQAIQDFYEKNPKFFEEPEKVKVAHVLLLTRDLNSGRDLPEPEQKKKRELIEKILARAKAGEDFKKLVKEFSEDKDSLPHDGELTFTRNSGRIPPQFEAASFSMTPGQVSDIVTTVFGYHVLKLIEKTPAKKVPMAEVKDKISEAVRQQEIQKQLPGYLEKSKKEAGVEINLPKS